MTTGVTTLPMIIKVKRSLYSKRHRTGWFHVSTPTTAVTKYTKEMVCKQIRPTLNHHSYKPIYIPAASFGHKKKLHINEITHIPSDQSALIYA